MKHIFTSAERHKNTNYRQWIFSHTFVKATPQNVSTKTQDGEYLVYLYQRLQFFLQT